MNKIVNSPAAAPDERTRQIVGVWNIVPTPFDDAGELDESSIAPLMDFVIGSGVNGITILGVAGEAAKLTDAERRTFIEGVLSKAGGSVPVCVGVNAGSTIAARAHAQVAEAAGAHSLLLAPPPGMRPIGQAVLDHYRRVAEAVSIPIVIQDHPAYSGVQMSVELLASITSASPLLKVIKLEAVPTPPKVAQLVAAIPGVTILGGLGGIMLLEELRHGAAGTMTGFAFPEVLVDIVGRFRSGDTEGAAETFYRYCPLIRFEQQDPLGLSIRKLVYHRRGALKTAKLRAPAPQLDATTIGDLDALLARFMAGGAGAKG